MTAEPTWKIIKYPLYWGWSYQAKQCFLQEFNPLWAKGREEYETCIDDNTLYTGGFTLKII